MCNCTNGCSDCGGLTCGEGAAGLNGLNAYTETTADFTQPSVSSNVTINVSALGQLTGLWAKVGQKIFVEGGGYYTVVSSTSTTIVATNTGETGNASPAATVSFPAGVSPAGVAGVAGAAGSNGSNGSNGTDGTTVLEVDLTEYEEDQNTFGTVTKSTTLAADTWETVDDIVELEMMFVSEKSAIFGVRVELDSNTLEINPTLTDFYFSYEVNYAKLKVQLILSASGEVTPITESNTSTGAVYADNTAIGFPSTASTRRGAAVTGLTTSGTLDLDVTLLSTVTGKNIKMFYYKLTSLKK